ncbi:MAG: sulfotransferase [Flavobacteriaceae bacterium]|nr:sulfotransferase [Flavobacteriaceae bacterium]
MNSNKNITKAFQKDNNLEKVLEELNNELQGSFFKELERPKRPIVLIMGCARSGSTVLLQYLSQLGNFSYPTNLIARFYKNPYVGIKIQQVLYDFDPLNQLDFRVNDKKFSSTLGKTYGVESPSEFWYFWRQYFDFSKSEVNYLNSKELSKINTNEFINKLSAFENLTSIPLVMKGMMLNWNIPFLHSIYDKFIFINLKRDIIPNAQSLLNAREKYFNNIDTWYSFKPKEYDFLKCKKPQEQVVGQVYYTQKAIEKGLKSIPNKNKIDISYDEFCENPFNLVKTLQKRFEQFDDKLEIEFIETQIKEMVFESHVSTDLSKNSEVLMSNFLKEIKS